MMIKYIDDIQISEVSLDRNHGAGACVSVRYPIYTYEPVSTPFQPHVPHAADGDSHLRYIFPLALDLGLRV